MYAACFAGHTRNYDKIMSSANKTLEDIGTRNYISTWTSSGSHVTFWSGSKDNDSYRISRESIMTLYHPKVLDIQSRSDYDYLNKFDFPMPTAHGVNALNTLLMFKKIKRSIDFAIKSEIQYDAIFRTRFDVQELSLPQTIKCEENTLYGKMSPTNGFFSDVFFYGKPEVMSRCIPDETFYTEELINTSLNAEEILSKYVKSKNIELKIVEDLSFRIRDVDF
jgi:hypothetical protein